MNKEALVRIRINKILEESGWNVNSEVLLEAKRESILKLSTRNSFSN